MTHKPSHAARSAMAIMLASVFALIGGPALAALGTSDTILTESCSKVMTIKNWLFNVVYILGAIGLVVIAISAFLGRFKFSHLIALGGGLFIVAGADLIISFMTSDTIACTGF